MLQMTWISRILRCWALAGSRPSGTIQSSAENLPTNLPTSMGRLELNCASFSLRECVDEVVVMFLYVVRSKGLQLDLVWDGSLPEYVTGDPARLRQILLNLVGNAFKFTDSGYIRILVSNNVCSQVMHKIL